VAGRWQVAGPVHARAVVRWVSLWCCGGRPRAFPQQKQTLFVGFIVATTTTAIPVPVAVAMTVVFMLAWL